MRKFLFIGLIAGFLMSLASVSNAQVIVRAPGVYVQPPVLMEQPRHHEWRRDEWRRDEWRRDHRDHRDHGYYDGR